MQYKVGVIGTGNMADRHCQILKNNRHVILDTIVSSHKSREISKEFCHKNGFKKFDTDIESITENNEIDIVVICSPDQFHPEQVMKLIKAEKNILCEKPLARTKNDFIEIINLLKKYPVSIQTGMNCRFREQYTKPKKIIDSEKLGKLKFIEASYFSNIVQIIKNSQKKWLTKYQKGINPLLHGGAIHCLDLMRWICGNVENVYVKPTSVSLKNEFENDTFNINLKFKNGIIGNCLISTGIFRPNIFSFDYHFEKGSILDNNKMYKYTNDKIIFSKDIQINQSKIDLQLQFEDLLKSIKFKKQPLNNVYEAFENFNLINAIENSILKDRVIKIS